MGWLKVMVDVPKKCVLKIWKFTAAEDVISSPMLSLLKHTEYDSRTKRVITNECPSDNHKRSVAVQYYKHGR